MDVIYSQNNSNERLANASLINAPFSLSINGTFMDTSVLEEFDELWSNYAGSQGLYSLYEQLKRYEDEYKETTLAMVSKWEGGTLRRDTRINDWLNTYLILKSYLGDFNGVNSAPNNL